MTVRNGRVIGIDNTADLTGTSIKRLPDEDKGRMVEICQEMSAILDTVRPSFAFGALMNMILNTYLQTARVPSREDFERSVMEFFDKGMPQILRVMAEVQKRRDAESGFRLQ